MNDLLLTLLNKDKIKRIHQHKLIDKELFFDKE